MVCLELVGELQAEWPLSLVAVAEGCDWLLSWLDSGSLPPPAGCAWSAHGPAAAARSVHVGRALPLAALAGGWRPKEATRHSMLLGSSPPAPGVGGMYVACGLRP